MNSITNVFELCDFLEGNTELSKLLGCTPQNISIWKRKGLIPRKWLFELQDLTSGAFDARSYLEKHYKKSTPKAA